MSIIRDVKQLKEAERNRRGENIQADKIGAAVAGHFGYQDLRGLWPLSNLDENFNAYDITGQGRTLTATDVVSGLYNNKIPYAEYNGSSSKHARTSEAGLQPGTDMVFGCWASVNSASNQWLLGKGDDYSLYIDGNGNPAFRMTDSGATLQIVTSSVTVVAGNWYNIVGRMAATSVIEIFVNGVWNSETALNDINQGATDFTLGYINASFGTFFTDGKIAWAFIGAAASVRRQIEQHYNSAKTAFKVYD